MNRLDDPLPDGWLPPSLWAQRLAANMVAFGIAWRAIPTSVRRALLALASTPVASAIVPQTFDVIAKITS